MRPSDPDFPPWNFLPVNPASEQRFRRWNIVIITLLGLLVLGLLLTAVVPQSSPTSSSSAARKAPTRQVHPL
jgi:hypothetical protein